MHVFIEANRGHFDLRLVIYDLRLNYLRLMTCGFGPFWCKSEAIMAMANDEQRDKQYCSFYIILLEKYH